MSKSFTHIVHSQAPYTRTFGPGNRHWSPREADNLNYIKVTESWMNDKLRARGVVFLNEVHEALGFDRTRDGQIMGWAGKQGKRIEFEIVESSEDQIILNFNPDGNVLFQLP